MSISSHKELASLATGSWRSVELSSHLAWQLEMLLPGHQLGDLLTWHLGGDQLEKS